MGRWKPTPLLLRSSTALLAVVVATTVTATVAPVAALAGFFGGSKAEGDDDVPLPPSSDSSTTCASSPFVGRCVGFLSAVAAGGGGGGRTLVAIAIALLLLAVARFLLRYRSAIKSRLREIEEGASVRVVRNRSSKRRKRVSCLELDPDFVAAHSSSFPMMSLGDYLGQLELAEGPLRSRELIRKQLDVAVGRVLLKVFGRTGGAALLPLLGAGSVSGGMAGLSDALASFLARCILEGDGDDGEGATIDPTSFDASLIELMSFANIHQKLVPPSAPDVTPIEYLGRGESAAAGEMAYDVGDGTFPTTFDMDRDFDEFVTRMEGRMRDKEGGHYDPDDRSLRPPPAPIDDRLLPGLCLGRGGLECTHTRREGVRHRLMCVLLNKLSHNYHLLSRGVPAGELFVVTCNGAECALPDELIHALMDAGHKVEVCPRAILTNFGLSLCVREDDGSYTSVPTAFMMRTGVESTMSSGADDPQRRPLYLAAPHGGMDLNISGPLIGGDGNKPAWIQFYVSVGGLTCFHPDEDQDCPWAAKTSLADVYPPDMALDAIRMCGLTAVAFNSLATDLRLPLGGYGIIGMCNDSSAIIDLAVRGTTDAYPLASTGRYLNHTVATLARLKSDLEEAKGMGGVIDDRTIECVRSLIRAACAMPSDLHVSPDGLPSMARRYDASYGTSVFRNTADARRELKEMAGAVGEYLD